VLAKVTVVKIANYGISVCGDVAAYISRFVMNIRFSKQNELYRNWLDLPLLVCVCCTVRK
jgi:hypothetical protein